MVVGFVVLGAEGIIRQMALSRARSAMSETRISPGAVNLLPTKRGIQTFGMIKSNNRVDVELDGIDWTYHQDAVNAYDLYATVAFKIGLSGSGTCQFRATRFASRWKYGVRGRCELGDSLKWVKGESEELNSPQIVECFFRPIYYDDNALRTAHLHESLDLTM